MNHIHFYLVFYLLLLIVSSCCKTDDYCYCCESVQSCETDNTDTFYLEYDNLIPYRGTDVLHFRNSKGEDYFFEGQEYDAGFFNSYITDSTAVCGEYENTGCIAHEFAELEFKDEDYNFILLFRQSKNSPYNYYKAPVSLDEELDIKIFNSYIKYYPDSIDNYLLLDSIVVNDFTYYDIYRLNKPLSYIEDSTRIQFVYFNTTNGIVKFEKYNGEIWDLIYKSK